MRFGLLGAVQVINDQGTEHRVPAAKQRILLAALLLNANGSVPRDTLIDTLWADDPPPNAAAALRTYLSRLRRVLGHAGEAISSAPSSVMITVRSPAELDVLEAEDLHARGLAAVRGAQWLQAATLLQDAESLWRGRPLADVPSDVLFQRDVPRLEELRIAITELRIDAELGLGRAGKLIGELRTLAAAHPLRERLHAQLMVALYRSQRRGEALAAYRDARRVLQDQLGLDPSAQLQDLHQQILAENSAPGQQQRRERSDEAGADGCVSLTVAQVAPRPESEARSSPTSLGSSVDAPRQLPARTRAFTGRQTEVARLRELIDTASNPHSPGTVVISAIDGMAGIGKTALALHIAHGVADRFPDGQLFIDLHGYTKGHSSRTAGEALESLLRALRVPLQQLPRDLEGRAALYRERLAGTRTLIVLDNAANDTQVSPLIPGEAGCLVLITSRRKLRALEDAYTLTLDVPPSADAITLFRTVAGPERSAVDDPAVAEIVSLCGRLPLAVRIAGALLRYRPAWSAEHLAGLLRDQRGRADVLSTSDRDLTVMFDLSYDSLAADHRRLFRYLGLIAGPDTDVQAAASLLDTTETTAHALLEHLVDHNLLIEHIAGRYRFHDLIRLHARALAEKVPPLEREDALTRVQDHYVHTAGEAVALIARRPWLTLAGPLPARAPVLPDSDAAWTWLRAERRNLTAWLEHAIRNEDDERTITVAAALTKLLGVDGPWAQAIAPATAAVAAAERVGDRGRQADALTALGIMRRLLDEHPGSIRDLGAALILFREIGDRSGEAAALSELGETSSFIDDYQGTMRDVQAALDLYRELDDLAGQAGTLFQLADVRILMGDYPGATRNAEAALDLFRRTGDRQGQARALNELGMVRRMTGDHSEATRYQEDALNLFRAMNDQNGEANVLFRLGELRSAAGDYPGAARDLQAAIDLFRRMGSQFGHAGALTLLGATRLATGDLASATRDLEMAVDIYRNVGSRGSEAWALNHHAAAVSATGDVTRAMEIYGDALRLAREVGQPDDEAAALNGIGESLLLQKENRQDGVTHLRQAAEIYRRLGMPAAERIVARLAELE